MRRILFILAIFIISLSLSAQQRGIKYYLPKMQTDSINVISSFIVQGDTFRLVSPVNGQILQRDSGIWKNMNNAASVFDSLHWNPSTGDLTAYKNGSPMSTQNLDGRYLLASNVADSLTGYMLVSVYDTANVHEQVVGIGSTQTIYNKTFILPTITNFSNATHNHSTPAQGDTIVSDYIKEGTTNLFSQWSNVSTDIYRGTGNVGIGGIPSYMLDVYGTTRTQILNVTSNIYFDGLTITDIMPGPNDNNYLATKGYVDQIMVDSVAYTDEQAQDAIGTILDDGTVGDVIFTYADATPKISGDVENDSHNHTGTTISGLSVSDFTSANVSAWTNDANYITSSQAVGGDLTGTIPNAQVTDDSHNHTVSTLPNLVSSVDGVTNDGGDINLIASGGITITPNDAENTITISCQDYIKLNSDSLLRGRGTTASPLKIDTSKIATQYDLTAYQTTLTTGNLTESITGLQFDNTRQVIGGAAALSLTSGYVIPTTTEQSKWNAAYTHTHTNDQDTSATNEIQNLSRSKTGNYVTLSISGGTGTGFSVADSDSSATNEIQNVSYTASTRAVAISGGTGFTFPTFSTTSTDPGLVTGGTSISAKFLRGDNSWQSVITAPAGSSGDIQYNNSGSLGGFGDWDGDILTIPGSISISSSFTTTSAQPIGISSSGYISFYNITAPAAPGSNTLGRLYMDSSDDKLYFKNSTTTYDLTGASGGSPGGSGSELQYRSGASTFGAVTGSSVSSNNITLTGTATASNFILSSDQRLKENIKQLSNLAWVDDIQIMSFNMKGDKFKRYGVIAQQVFKVNPELVRINQDGLYSVAYTDFLIAKVARQDQKIKSLEERLLKLENMLK